MSRIYKIYNKKYKIYYDTKGEMHDLAGHAYSDKGKIFSSLKNARISITLNKLKDCIIYEYPLTVKYEVE